MRNKISEKSSVVSSNLLVQTLLAISIFFQVNLIGLIIGTRNSENAAAIVLNNAPIDSNTGVVITILNLILALVIASITLGGIYKLAPFNKLGYKLLLVFSTLSIIPISYFTSLDVFKNSSPLSTLFILFQPLATLVYSAYVLKIELKGNVISRVLKTLIFSSFAYMLVVVCFAFWNFGFWMYDYGTMIQIIYNGAFNGNWNSTLLGYSYFGEHVEPILIFVMGIYRIFPYPITLAIFQVFITAAAAFVLFKLVLLKTKSTVNASLVTCVFALSPTVFSAIVFPFHEVIFYPFLVFSIYLAVEKKSNIFIVLVLLIALLAVKEDAAFLVAGIGLHLFLTEKKYKWIGLAIAPIALVYLGVCMSKIIPHFRGGAFPFLVMRYEDIVPKDEPTILGVIKFVLSNPNFVLQKVLLNPLKITFLIYLILPFLPWIKRSKWVNFIPLVILLPLALLSNDENQYNIARYHIPIIFCSGVMLLFIFIRKEDTGKFNYKMIFTFASSIMLLFHVGGLNAFSMNLFTPHKNSDLIQNLLDKIPSTASVSAHGHLGVQLSNRERIDLYPSKATDHDYVVFEIDPLLGYWASKREIYVQQAINLINQGYKIEDKVDYVFLLKKSTDTLNRQADLRSVKNVCLLPSQLNTVTAKVEGMGSNTDVLLFKSDSKQRSSVFFGPYLNIASGKYKLKIKTKYSGDSGAIAHLKIVDTGIGTEFRRASFPLTQANKVLQLEIDFNMPNGAQVFETPFDFEGKGTIQILSYELEAL